MGYKGNVDFQWSVISFKMGYNQEVGKADEDLWCARVSIYRCITWFSSRFPMQEAITNLPTGHIFKTLLLQRQVHESFVENYTDRKRRWEMCTKEGEGIQFPGLWRIDIIYRILTHILSTDLSHRHTHDFQNNWGGWFALKLVMINPSFTPISISTFQLTDIWKLTHVSWSLRAFRVLETLKGRVLGAFCIHKALTQFGWKRRSLWFSPICIWDWWEEIPGNHVNTFS